MSTVARRGYLFAGVAATGWGLWPLFLHRAEARGAIPAALEGLLPLIAMTLATLPFTFRHPLPKSLGPWLAMAWLGVSDAGNVLCFFSAYQKTSVAIAVLTHYLTPLLVALLSPLFTEERFERRSVFAAVVSLAGLVVLLEPWRSGLSASDAIGALLGALSACFYASNVIVQKRLSGTFSSAQILGLHGLVTVPILYLRVPAGAFDALYTDAWLWLSTGSVLLGLGCCMLFLMGLRTIPASHASMLTLMEPITAVLLGAFVLGQPLRVATILGGLVVLAGAVMSITGGKRDDTPTMSSA
jgi:drug/metabolite transporter (DMT)-like permease